MAVWRRRPECRKILIDRGQHVLAGCAEKLGEDEMRELQLIENGLGSSASMPSNPQRR